VLSTHADREPRIGVVRCDVAMTRFVIGADVALHLARLQAVVPAQHQLLAPTLIRSQVLAALYGRVQRGELDRKSAERQLDHLRTLRLRLLGDRVLQGRAWDIARQLGWPDTFVAEYIALTQLQADAFVCMDPTLSRAVSGIVKVAAFDDLLSSSQARQRVASAGHRT
jgi:predicted nucleic acid-binding protein